MSNSCPDVDPLHHAETGRKPRTRSRKRVICCGVLPGIALLLASAAGYLQWHDSAQRRAQSARVEAIRIASSDTVAMLSYTPDSVEHDLSAAGQRLADGPFKDSYFSLIRDVVIPGAKQQRISSVANVAAAASVSATPDHAVVLVFVDQSTTTADQLPTSASSSVRVTLHKQDDTWRITQFDPV